MTAVRSIRTAIIASIVVSLAACGGDGSAPEGSSAGSDGLGIAQSAGCTGCHGSEGQGGVGPSWQGLAGSTVELEDGSTVAADTDYLRRAITHPDADVVAGSTVEMPANDLSDEQVDAVVGYIESLD